MFVTRLTQLLETGRGVCVGGVGVGGGVAGEGWCNVINIKIYNFVNSSMAVTAG